MLREMPNQTGNGEARDHHRHQHDHDQNPKVERNAAEGTIGQKRHERAHDGKAREKRKEAGQHDATAMHEAEAQYFSDGSTVANDTEGIQNDGGGIHIEREYHRQDQDGQQVGGEDAGGGNGQGREIRVVAGAGKNAVPFEHDYHAGDGHGEDDEEVFVGQRLGIDVELMNAAEPLQERGVFVKEEYGEESARHEQQAKHATHAHVGIVRSRFALEDGGGEMRYQTGKRPLKS